MPPVNVASAMVEGGRLRLRRPVSSLRADLGCFWSIETTSATRLRTLPDACATLSVESGQGIALKCFLVGPRQTPAEGAPPAGQTLFGVRLKPGVTFVLTGVPVHTLVERRVRLAALLPEDGSRLEKRLAGTRTVDDGIDVWKDSCFKDCPTSKLTRVFRWHSNELKNAAGRFEWGNSPAIVRLVFAICIASSAIG